MDWLCIGENRDAYVLENAIMSKSQMEGFGAKLLPLYFLSHSIRVRVLVGEGEIEGGSFDKKRDKED